MSGSGSGRQWIAMAAVSVLTGLTAVVLMAARAGVPVQPGTDGTSGGAHGSHLLEEESVGAVVTAEAVDVHEAPSPQAPVQSHLRAGVLLPALALEGDFVQVMTPCEVTGWVNTAAVHIHPRATGDPTAVEEATILVDPGHGGPLLPGAVGPTGLTEKEANLETSRRLAAKLGGARVFLTRDDDYTAGIPYRAELADRLGAHAFVSVHYNAAPDLSSSAPGTETYYQVDSEASKRLAGLLYEEVFAAVAPHDVAWVANQDAGAKYRINSEGRDVFGVLRRPGVPSVLVEGLFISNAPEEELLRRPEVHEDVADAMAGALRRYFATDDAGSGFVESRPTRAPSSGRLPSVCIDPA